MKVILWDIETSRMTVKSFGLFKQNISHNDIVEDWRILCICWKELGKSKVHSVDCMEEGDYKDDRNVVERMHSVLMDADVVIGHNIKKFDVKKFNSKVIEYGLPPLPNIIQIDTYTETNKIARFSSHRLDFLSKKTSGEGKIVNEPGLWARCEAGDEKAMRSMVKYCKRDVKANEDYYLRLRPYIKNHPTLHMSEDLQCGSCGSVNMKKHKDRITAGGIVRKQYQCGDCGSYHTPRYGSIVEKSHLKSI